MSEQQRTILIVDDEASQRDMLGGFIRSLGFQSREAASGEQALEAVQADPPAMVLLDVRLPGMSGIEVLAKIREHAERLPVLLITAYADLRQAVAAMKGGADDYLAKPIDLDELKTAIDDAIGPAGGESVAARAPHPDIPDWFVFKSPAMRHVVETAAVVAPSDAPVLITGESGTGKRSWPS